MRVAALGADLERLRVFLDTLIPCASALACEADALRYTFVDGAQPLIVFMKNIQTKEEFQEYYGGTRKAFLDAVQDGRVLPTVATAGMYMSGLMRNLFRDWRKRREERWSAYSDILQDAGGALKPSEKRSGAQEVFNRLAEGWTDMPREHDWVITGRPSGLPPRRRSSSCRRGSGGSTWSSPIRPGTC